MRKEEGSGERTAMGVGFQDEGQAVNVHGRAGMSLLVNGRGLVANVHVIQSAHSIGHRQDCINLSLLQLSFPSFLIPFPLSHLGSYHLQCN
jgi:hypothetical protein